LPSYLDRGDVLFQPSRRAASHPGGVDRLAHAHNVILLYVLHVHTEKGLPLVQIGHCTVHPQRPAAKQTVSFSTEMRYRSGGAHVLHDLAQVMGPDVTQMRVYVNPSWSIIPALESMATMPGSDGCRLLNKI